MEPFVIGIWCGESKPILNEYIKPFISEMKILLANGLMIGSNLIRIMFGLCISDTPARVMMKGEYFILTHA